jgi:hypothetical protein
MFFSNLTPDPYSGHGFGSGNSNEYMDPCGYGSRTLPIRQPDMEASWLHK